MRRKALIHIIRFQSRLAVTAAPIGALVCALLLSPATPLAPVAEAKPPRDSVFTGSVERGGPVAFRVSPNGRMVKRATASLYLECSDGGGFSFDDRWDRVRIRPGGRISASFTTSDSDGEATYDISSSLRGRMNRHRLKITGTWQLSISIHDLATGETITCDSGPARFTARR